ncbi:MAG: hypothetical protein NZP74_05885 [Anaerolineales bacterium]|nr:hypothetical protein [Anaerolineales bacterium]MDW8276467.1 hypothetical protein [Anaerolineales bacterium]
MGEETLDRREFLSRIGVFFFIIGVFALMIFISTDVSRTGQAQAIPLTNTAYAALAIQTQQAGAATAQAQNLPTPTRVKVKDLRATQEFIMYGVQVLQTRDAAQKTAVALGIPPTPIQLAREDIENYIQSRQSFSYLAFLCIGALGIGGGLLLLRMSAPPPKPAGRFARIRAWLQKMREDRKKRAEARQKKK